MKKDDVEYVVEALKKRDEILIKGKSTRQYNKYFDIMCKYARRVIDAGRQDELLPLLDSDNVSYRHDIAGLLYHCYPEKCQQVLKEISEMSVKTGLQKYDINLSVAAEMALEIGIPEDFP